VRVVTVVGNRPQFVKSASLSAGFRDAGIEEVVVHTGQHYDRELSEIFFSELGLAEPRYRLRLETADPETMEPAIRGVIESEEPDWVLVLGDTNTTLAGARAAGGTPLAHVEAGLRSFDLTMPEERNRIEVDQRSALLFCPDERSARQLEEEEVTGDIEVVGDVMADANRLFGPIARERSEVLARLGVEPRGYVLATVHREANVRPERLARIVEGLNRIDQPVVFPAHPRTRAVLTELRPRFEPIDPLGYLDFMALESQACVIATDSGGVQKEAYWHGVPCVTLRANTEWTDTVAAGANVLVDDDPDAIVQAVADARFPDDAPSLYGDGEASGRIATALYASGP
jgi:UDP-N-acetylglucosamine 2-epimerase